MFSVTPGIGTGTAIPLKKNQESDPSFQEPKIRNRYRNFENRVQEPKISVFYGICFWSIFDIRYFSSLETIRDNARVTVGRISRKNRLYLLGINYVQNIGYRIYSNKHRTCLSAALEPQLCHSKMA